LSGRADDRRVLRTRDIPDAPAGSAGRDEHRLRPTIRAMAHRSNQGGTAMAIDIHVLLDEIRRYLAAVEAFREEGCEPEWRS
jgi:hypothetical protein